MGKFLIVIFVPPVHYFLQKRWGAFAINGAVYALALVFFASIVGAPIAPFFWFVAMAFAMFDLVTALRRQTLEEHAALVGKAVAANVSAGRSAGARIDESAG